MLYYFHYWNVHPDSFLHRPFVTLSPLHRWVIEVPYSNTYTGTISILSNIPTPFSRLAICHSPKLVGTDSTEFAYPSFYVLFTHSLHFYHYSLIWIFIVFNFRNSILSAEIIILWNPVFCLSNLPFENGRLHRGKKVHFLPTHFFHVLNLEITENQKCLIFHI